ncbi:sublancin family glycopeptide [Priestia megaterium]
MTQEILELMEEVTVEEMELVEGKGLSAAQCAWMAVSCVNYIPGVGSGCGGDEICKEYWKYCK